MNNYTFYRIICCDPNITDSYVGSTIDFHKRKILHKSSCNNSKCHTYNYKLYQIIRENKGWNNWQMIEIETVSLDKKTAHVRERYWVEKFNATLNTFIPSRTMAEWSVGYYQKNKEELNKQHADYYQSNKEKLNKQHADYYQKNKEQITQRRSQKITCVCGGCYTIQHKVTHLKTSLHKKYIDSLNLEE